VFEKSEFGPELPLLNDGSRPFFFKNIQVFVYFKTIQDRFQDNSRLYKVLNCLELSFFVQKSQKILPVLARDVGALLLLGWRFGYGSGLAPPPVTHRRVKPVEDLTGGPIRLGCEP
jgi:hypothetical protein